MAASSGPGGTGPVTHRIAYIDGLRALAIAMVVLYHAWGYHAAPYFNLNHSSSIFEFLVSQGKEGVTLFFVLSGFCLSFPLLRRRDEGTRLWFVPSYFFARRCLRILPPYYAAYGLGLLASFLLAAFHSPVLSAIGRFPSLPNLVTHLLLLHNLTPWIYSNNGALWSLGLEWQWYFAFPVVLLFCVRFPRATLVLCLVMALVWFAIAYRVDRHGLDLVHGGLPGSLFMFALGIYAADVMVQRRHIPTVFLVLAVILPLLASEAVIGISVSSMAHTFAPFRLISHASAGLYRPLDGIAFTSLVLLGHRSRLLNSVLSWRPLVGLGIASYSVYLVHQPIIQAMSWYGPAPIRQSILEFPAVVAVALGAGILFHFAIERPAISKSTWNRVSPVLIPRFHWADSLWQGDVATSAAPWVEPAVPARGPEAQSAVEEQAGTTAR